MVRELFLQFYVWVCNRLKFDYLQILHQYAGTAHQFQEQFSLMDILKSPSYFPFSQDFIHSPQYTNPIQEPFKDFQQFLQMNELHPF